jgi:hypothetical protein
LQWFLGELAQDGRRVESNLRPFCRRRVSTIRQAVSTDDVVQWRHQVGVTQSIGYNAVDVRELAVDWMSSVDPDDRSNTDR